MCGFIIFIIIILLTFNISKSEFDTECPKFVEETKNSSTVIARSFTDEQLTDFCKKHQSWIELKSKPGTNVEGIEERPGATTSVTKTFITYTIQQKVYLNSIWGCKEKVCFSDERKNIFLSSKFKEKVEHRLTLSELQLDSGKSDGDSSGGKYSDSSFRVIRKEYRTMSTIERNRFHSAINKLKTDQIDGKSKYDLLVEWHNARMAPEAHFSCAFLPFHREFLKHLELALRFEDPNAFLPYWDSTLDEGLPNPCDSVLWSLHLIGNADGFVTSGPFSNWTATNQSGDNFGEGIYRSCGSNKRGRLINPADIYNIMNLKSYQEMLCFCTNILVEGAHGVVHNFVGGHMSSIELSPNDPVFFLHHAFIDYIWEKWRLVHQNRQQRQTQYPANNDTCNSDDIGNDQMKPFIGLKITDGLNNYYTDVFYTYSISPYAGYCKSPYLFFNERMLPPRCLAKIKMGGNCSGFDGLNSCYNGDCVSGTCILKSV